MTCVIIIINQYHRSRHHTTIIIIVFDNVIIFIRLVLDVSVYQTWPSIVQCFSEIRSTVIDETIYYKG